MGNELERDEQGRVILKKARYSGVRKIIGNNMSQSLQKAPQATITMKVDTSALYTVKQKFADEGMKVTFNDILLKLVGEALIQCPATNSACVDGKYIYSYANANIGVAVGTDHGLYVPVIKDVQDKTIPQLHDELKEKALNLREGKILPEYFQGGTFSVSNLGMYGIDVMTPILNMPEAGILCLGTIKKEAVVENDEVVIRPMMWLSFTLDHSVMDGTDGSAFMGTMKKLIMNPPF